MLQVSCQKQEQANIDGVCLVYFDKKNLQESTFVLKSTCRENVRGGTVCIHMRFERVLKSTKRTEQCLNTWNGYLDKTYELNRLGMLGIDTYHGHSGLLNYVYIITILKKIKHEN